MHAPALVVAVPLVSGVAIGALHGVPTVPVAWALGICWLVAIVALARSDPRVFLAACAGLSVCAGMLIGTHAERAALEPTLLTWYHRGSDTQNLARITGHLRDDAAALPSAVSVTIDVDRVSRDDRPEIVSGGIRLTVAGALAARMASGWRGGRPVVVDAALREPLDYRDPGVASDRLRLARQGIVLLGSVKSAALLEVTGRGSWLDETAGAVRALVRRAIAAAVAPWSAKSAGVVTAILIGDRTGLDPEDERKLQDAGTYHVIAISGGNIALLMMLLVAAGRTVRLPVRAASGISIVLLAFYGYAAGLAPSVLRATIAGVIYLFARVLDHRGAALNALAVAGGYAAATAPLTVIDPGFILSFGATAGIIVGASRLAAAPRRNREARRLRRVISEIGAAARGLGAATICAEIALAPVAARLFARISFAGLALNFIAIPLMGVIQFAGIAAVALQPLAPPIASACGFVAHISTVALLRSAGLVDVARWTVQDVPPPAWWLLVAWYGGWAVLMIVARRTIRRAGVVLLVTCGVLLLLSPPVTRAVHVDPAPAGWTRVVFIDVGQGDAALISTPGASPMLIDAGGVAGTGFDLGRRVTVPVCWAFGAGRLARLVLTHPDPDHIGGAPAVLRALRPREVWEGVPVPPHVPLQQVHALADAYGARWMQVHEPTVFTHGALSVRVLHPPQPEWERRKARNDDSVALDVRLGNVALVLPGDVSQSVEDDVLRGFTPAPLVIVKAPHHGSPSSSSPAFVEGLHPAAVIFSAGRRNSFGHPSPLVVDRYRAAGAAVFRTDNDGAIVVDTDGSRVVIWTWEGKRVELSIVERKM